MLKKVEASRKKTAGKRPPHPQPEAPLQPAEKKTTLIEKIKDYNVFGTTEIFYAVLSSHGFESVDQLQDLPEGKLEMILKELEAQLPYACPCGTVLNERQIESYSKYPSSEQICYPCSMQKKAGKPYGKDRRIEG